MKCFCEEETVRCEVKKVDSSCMHRLFYVMAMCMDVGQTSTLRGRAHHSCVDMRCCQECCMPEIVTVGIGALAFGCIGMHRTLGACRDHCIGQMVALELCIGMHWQWLHWDALARGCIVHWEALAIGCIA